MFGGESENEEKDKSKIHKITFSDENNNIELSALVLLSLGSFGIHVLHCAYNTGHKH